MTSYRACEACGADLPDDRTACLECGRVACWDCGTANGAGQAFCRRCGVWLVGQGSTSPVATPAGPGSPSATMPAAATATLARASGPWSTRPIASTPIRIGPTPRRGRWAALTLAVLLASAALASAAALEMRRPDGTTPALAALGPEDVAGAAAPLSPASPSPAPTQADVRDAPRALTAATEVPEPPSTPAPPDPVERSASTTTRATERRATPAPARARSGWTCDDSVRLSDAQGRRWIVERVSFRAMSGYERVILHLDQDGPASMTATAFAAPMAASSVRGSGGSTSRSSMRRGIGVELAGGLRSGLELRGFRPQGLRTIRDLSLVRSGATSRLLIGVTSAGCFRMRAPAWQSGSAGSDATGQLIIDVRR